MSLRLSKEEVDAQFELFLKESVSDDSVDLGASEKQPPAKSNQSSAAKPTLPWWQDEEHDESGTSRETTSRFIKSRKPPGDNNGLSGSGKSLRESLGTSSSIQEEGEAPVDVFSTKEVIRLSDKGEIEDLENIPALNMVNMELDTLEEEEAKAGFFAKLEAGALSTIDYSKLNQELDSPFSTFESSLRKAMEAAEQNNDRQTKARVTETTPPGSSHYSEDFENEEKEKEPQEQEEEEKPMSSVIARVSLFDSLDDTGGENRAKDTADSMDKGNSYVKSGGSEMEALHDAYRQIHVVEESGDFNGRRRSSSLEGRELLHRSPSPPAQHYRQSIQPVSTNESDLPTAEELMRPIRIDDNHVRGFTLQPVSSLETYDLGKQAHSLEKTFTRGMYSQSKLKELKKTDVPSKIKEANESTTQRADSPDRDPVWSISEEVERLMEDHNKTVSTKSSQAGKVEKQVTSHSSKPSHPSSVRKPSTAPARGKTVERRTKATTKSKETYQNTERSEMGSSELVTSVQSLVTLLQQQIESTSPQETGQTRQPPEISNGDSMSEVKELRALLTQREQEIQAMKEAAEELHSLRQENYVLQSKLRSAEESSQRVRWTKATDSTTDETFKQMEKEIKEQETLIKGYQQENEKLCLQMKDQKAKSKANEEAMFHENQRMLSELNSLREKQSNTSDQSRRTADLLAQIKTYQMNEAGLFEDIDQLKQERHILTVELRLLKTGSKLGKTQVISNSGDRTFEMQLLEDKHQEEVSALKTKLQKFTENQGLLDRDADRLRAATGEIQQLKEQVKKLKADVSKRSGEQQRKTKEKSWDMKKMQDLQRQVKELEYILKHRNPNSLPALIYAAATAEHEEDTNDQAKKVTELLEHRIQCLEAELENHDEEAKHTLRAMEEQFHSVKLRYEQQILQMEHQLQQKQHVEVSSSASEDKAWESRIHTLAAELEQVKENYREKETSLQEQIKSLQQQQLKSKEAQSPGRHQRQAEEAFGVRIERLKYELSNKTRAIQELSRTVEKLQKERRCILSVSVPQADNKSTESRKHAGPIKTHSTVSATQTNGTEETFPAALDEKTYQPTVYAGSHVTEVLQENTVLTRRLEQLELQREKEQEALKAEAVKAREELQRHQELSVEQLSTLKAQHLRELNQLRAAHAVEYSSSKVAEQASKINTQEIRLKYLQEQLKELQGIKGALTLSKTRESVLEKQLIRLLKELKEAREAQSSEVKLLWGLEQKIQDLDLRHQNRETELKQRINGSWPLEASQQTAEVEHWKNLAQEKCREIEAFRLELDSILDIIKQLQKQGVVFPRPGQSH